MVVVWVVAVWVVLLMADGCVGGGGAGTGPAVSSAAARTAGLNPRYRSGPSLHHRCCDPALAIADCLQMIVMLL